MEYPKASIPALEKAKAWLVNSLSCVLAAEVGTAIAEIERLRAGQFRWIPLKEREPTAADGDEFGYVFINYHPEPGIRVRHGSMLHFQVVGNSGVILAWAQIPPLPERTQEEKDEEIWNRYINAGPNLNDMTYRDAKFVFMCGLKAARGEK